MNVAFTRCYLREIHNRALARGADLVDATRLGAAAGALNVTRGGLGTGNRDTIERIAEHVEIKEH